MIFDDFTLFSRRGESLRGESLLVNWPWLLFCPWFLYWVSWEWRIAISALRAETSSWSVATATLWHETAGCVGSGVGSAAGLSNCSASFWKRKNHRNFKVNEKDPPKNRCKNGPTFFYHCKDKKMLHSTVYLILPILDFFATTRVKVTEGPVSITLDITTSFALLHGIRDRALGVTARFDFWKKINIF